MHYSKETIGKVNSALEEAQLLGLEFDRARGIVAATFRPVALDENGQVPEDNRVLLVFSPVGRFIAVLREEKRHDKTARIVRFEPEEILEKVHELGHQPIYGGDFIDSGENWNHHKFDELSFEYDTGESSGRSHTFDLFQEGGYDHLDVRIWFDEFRICTPKYEPVSVDDFAAAAWRGWGNPGTFGIQPLEDAVAAAKAARQDEHEDVKIAALPKTNLFTSLWRKLWN